MCCMYDPVHAARCIDPVRADDATLDLVLRGIISNGVVHAAGRCSVGAENRMFNGRL